MNHPDAILEGPAHSRMPRDENGPVFAEPWQAAAFALAIKLTQHGYFTPREWAAALARELKDAADRGEPDDGSNYYTHFLAALEKLIAAKGIGPDTLAGLRDPAT